MGVPSTVSQVVTTSTSHILSGFHSCYAVSVQGIPFEGSFNTNSVVVVKIVYSHMSTSTVSVPATSPPGSNTVLTRFPISWVKLDNVKSYIL